MNRIIKFRAWDGKEMFNLGPSENFGVDGQLIVRDGVTVMQFTGLLDSKGVEIYEGDVVLFTDRDESKTRRVVVEYKIFQENGDAGYYLNFSGHMEVIGNVFEHPNLLK